MHIHNQHVFQALALLAACLLAGCSSKPEDMPELGQVSGTITLDGQPLEGAEITFEPQAGTLSVGSTDETGHYELAYSKDYPGAILGTHTVRISKMGEPGSPNDTENQVPAKFNAGSKLTAEVKTGENTVNFDLDSKQ